MPPGFAVRFEDLTFGLAAQAGRWILWVPVGLGLGIGGYFSLRFEPAHSLVLLCVGAVGVFVWLAWILRHGIGLLPFLCAMIALGGVAAKWRSDLVAGPVLGWRYYGPVQGRVVDIDRSASDKLRITLDQVRLDRIAPRKTPQRVRVTLHGPERRPRPGAIIQTTAHLSAPPGRVEPFGFDFRRHAWFQRLGAVGYTRVAWVLWEPEDANSLKTRVFALRMAIAGHLKNRLGPDTGGVAAAITTGVRSGIPRDTTLDLRQANLAHLLAISGLHMGLLVGFVFALIQGALALTPLALWLPARKIAACVALIFGAFYLALSGGSIATERAFIMVATLLCAVLLDRQAITLRAVAVAATILLLMQPEALVSPGFQMSFAATIALIVVFRTFADRNFAAKGLMGGAIGLVVSSLIAGLATAPFAAAHFNMMSHYGLVANVLAVPVMGAIVMPAAVFAVILWPIGLSWLPLWVMDLGLRWILTVADVVSGWPGAVSFIPQPPAGVLAGLAIGALWIILWQGAARHLGWACLAVCAFVWATSHRPDILISETAGLVGLRGADGLALSRAKGEGFAASVWLENDGDPALQAHAAARPKTLAVRHVLGKGVPECGQDVLILNHEPATKPECDYLGPKSLRETGAMAGWIRDGHITWISARDVTGMRPWSGWRDQ